MPYLNRFPGAKDAHEFEAIYGDEDKTVICRVCLTKWKRQPNHGKCAGVPVYQNWEDVSPKLVSKTALYRDYKRKLGEGALPVAAVRHDGNSYTPLYLITQGNPNYERKRKSSKPIPEAEERIVQVFDPFGWLEGKSE